jgi:hypothetical protein
MISILAKFIIADNLTTVDFFWLRASIIEKTPAAMHIQIRTKAGTCIDAWLKNSALHQHSDYYALAPWAIDEKIESIIQNCASRSL